MDWEYQFAGDFFVEIFVVSRLTEAANDMQEKLLSIYYRHQKGIQAKSKCHDSFSSIFSHFNFSSFPFLMREFYWILACHVSIKR